MNFIISSIGFILWAITIISIYYSKSYSSIDHLESSTGYGGYIASMVILYGMYKFYTISAGIKKLHFGFFSIVGIILAHLFLLSIIYSGFPEVSKSPFMTGGASSIVLFFHVISLLIYPLILIFLARDIGYSAVSYLLPKWRDSDIRLRVPVELSIGFTIFVTSLLILGSIGYFTLPGLFILLGLMALAGYTGHKETYHDIKHRVVTLENHNIYGNMNQVINLKLLSIEFGFFFLVFLFSIALIGIIRPMPIGWDDLGVYMNFPKIMASTNALLEGSGMYAWQLITATGFLFSYTAAEAFYINQIGGILAVIAIISTLSFAFEKKGRTLILSLPVLFAAVFYAMPMTVFQQAKDMKLDPAYFFFAISGLTALLYLWNHHEDKRTRYTLLGIIGIIVGFSLTVKLTSIMLILGCLGVIAYRILSFYGYLGFFFIFLSIFTKLNLWSMMNVPMPKDDPALMTSISIFLFVVGIVFLFFAFLQSEKKDFMKHIESWIVSSLIFLIGTGIACVPWFAKNISEIGTENLKNLTIGSLLSGSGGITVYPYDSLISEEEKAKRQAIATVGVTKDGKSDNEDLGRYFGYEGGLDNYLKLPANLTFQKNQSGEFTDITYIFLALLPGLLLFIRGRRPYTMLAWCGVLIAFMAIYYFTKNESWDAFFGQFSLIMNRDDWKSYGYAILLAMNLIILALFHFGTAKNDDNKKLSEIIMFMGIYAFLFMIAAFGIVWYGIVIYFGFFLIMGYSALTFISDTDEEYPLEDNSLNFTMSAILFGFIGFYFVFSAFPHGWNNLRSAYYNEYKYNTLSQEESIFAYRSDYLLPIATMNLKSIPAIFDGIASKMQSTQMKEFIEKTDFTKLPIDDLHAFIMKNRNAPDIKLRNDVRFLGQHLYSSILYPPKENQNRGGIYRIGTFMTYLINNNRKRYLEDSLVTVFDEYMYTPNYEETIRRMQKLGLNYLLVDLNAATIDRDPRHALTDRAERLLLTMNAKNLKLVSTDNFCLELAISERKKGKLVTDDEFIDIAGTNYESYRDGKTIYRNEKLSNCHRYIVNLINTDRASEYPTVENIKNELLQANASQDAKKLQEILIRYAGQSWFAFFEIIDIPEVSDATETLIGTGITNQ